MQGILLLLGIFAVAVLGGSKNASFVAGPQTPEQKQERIAKQIRDAQTQVDELKKKIQAAEDAKTRSIHYGKVRLGSVSRSQTANGEYITLYTDSFSTTSIPLAGWTIKSRGSGQSIAIPQATLLFFAGHTNGEQNIVLSPGDIVYLVTGHSPNGASFKINKCSGYLEQFQDFTPYISSECPAPRNEDLSSIPRRTVNDACFDYIEYMPSCRIHTGTLPQNWSYECLNFITTKINYPSCVNTHKGDSDFYKKEWRVFLKRTEPLWKSSREDIVLLDAEGKIVSELKY